jgi:hypothetical protein
MTWNNLEARFEMAIPKRMVRGVRDVRTRSGSVGRTLAPHEAHMRLCVLEMEKVRRNAEKESALARVKAIDARFEEIEAECRDLLEVLSGCGIRILPPGKPEKTTRNPEISVGKGFKIVY